MCGRPLRNRLLVMSEWVQSPGEILSVAIQDFCTAFKHYKSDRSKSPPAFLPDGEAAVERPNHWANIEGCGISRACSQCLFVERRPKSLKGVPTIHKKADLSEIAISGGDSSMALFQRNHRAWHLQMLNAHFLSHPPMATQCVCRCPLAEREREGEFADWLGLRKPCDWLN